jgi:predicted Zn-ribbon and HTH transcriptional regulator
LNAWNSPNLLKTILRKDLIDLLLDTPMSLNDVRRHVKAPTKTIEDDLIHLFKSLKYTEYEEAVIPAKCRKCDFVFSTEKLSKPSRCPECKGTWLFEPRISIRVRESRR